MYIRTISRAVARSSPSAATASPIACLNARRLPIQQQQTRAASEHAIANPTLAGIEKRWEVMPPQEQAELWMQLRDRMKVDWKEMTLQEKKAGMLPNSRPQIT
jgi:cytochrome c oxidase subunit 4